MSELWVVPDFAGTQAGTKDNPFAARDAIEFDSLMREHAHIAELHVFLNDGVFSTASTKEWADTNDVQRNRGFRAGRHWTFDLAPDATLRWDVDAVPDDEIDDTPLHLIMSTEARFDSRLNWHTPEEVWNLLPRGQAVRGGTIDLQFSKAVDRWKAKGKKLQIGAVALAGHQAAIEGVHVTSYGADGHEAFPLYIQGAYGMYDRDLIAQLDPATHVFDAGLSDEECSHIIHSPVDGYCEDSNDQVTARFIAGSVGQRSDGSWQQHFRAFAYQSGNRTIATGSNMVQAHTIYQSLRGLISKNYGECAVLVYGDTYGSRGIVVDDNDHKGYHGVQLLLGPGGVCPEQTWHEDYTITANNRFNTNGPNVRLDTLAEQYKGPPTDRRYIRGIKIDRKFSVENKGAEVIWTGGSVEVPDPAERKGCSPFRFFQH